MIISLRLFSISGKIRSGWFIQPREVIAAAGGVSAPEGGVPHNGGFLNARSFAKESAYNSTKDHSHIVWL
jgi:hypothetical protein